MEHVLLWFHGKFLCNYQLTRSIIGFRDCALASRVGVKPNDSGQTIPVHVRLYDTHINLRITEASQTTMFLHVLYLILSLDFNTN